MVLTETVTAAKSASIQLAAAQTGLKNRSLAEIAAALKQQSARIISANKKDLAAAKRNNLSAALLRRLAFGEGKIAEVCRSIESLIKLAEPVGKTLSRTELDDGLRLYKVSCPIGVIGVVFESRPDALVQISTLCLKSGNAVLLKGGSEAEHTNKMLADIISQAGEEAGLPKGWLGLLESRRDAAEMLKADEYIDLIIPRGSKQFVRYIMDNTTIPVLGHADGICHVYIAGQADLDMAEKIVVDSKSQYAAVCNAAETLLVDEKIAEDFLPRIKAALEAKGVELRGCQKTCSIIDVKAATEEDWTTEYLDLILSVKVVAGVDEAIGHINRYGSGHTDTIVTADRETADEFMDLVDSANVFWNASTRFSDGYRYGLGAEVGISTNKIHARGPVGLDGLVIYKWKLIGHGQTVAEYAEGIKKFTHRRISDSS